MSTNPATPAQAATPGVSESNQPNPPAASTPGTSNGAGDQSEGKVTITTREFAQLQRDAARYQSFQRRQGVTASRNNPGVRAANGDSTPNGDPAQEAITNLETRAAEAERRAMQLEVKDRIRDVLADPKYAGLPQSTKDLILKNPASLSEADNADEAILDIEDFLIDQIGKVDSSLQNKGGGADGTRPAATPGHDTPQANASAPTAPKGNEAEDVSKLTGSARSRAMIRNKIRTPAGG